MTIDLRTTYLGLPLAHPIVASAGPLTGRLDTLVALQEAGAAAVTRIASRSATVATLPQRWTTLSATVTSTNCTRTPACSLESRKMSDSTSVLLAPSVAAVNEVGAGDCLVGGLAIALDRGESMLDAARFGVACGTTAILSPGLDSCTRETIAALASQVSVSHFS